MNQSLDIFVLIAIPIILLVLFYKAWQIHTDNRKVNKSIIDYFQNEGFIIQGISRLNFTERIRYSVPIIPTRWIYNQLFGLISDKINLIKKVELTNQSGKEYIKYIEINISGSEAISIKEIDSYEY